MTDQTKTQLEALMDQIGELWRYLDILFDDLEANNGWGQKHGPDWTFADVPYHLAYCNQDIVIKGLELEEGYPQDEQELLATMEDVAAWNTRKFAQRPADQSAAQSVAQWRASCDKIRELTAQMNDADLNQGSFWMKLGRGWTTPRAALEFTRGHDYSEFLQLRIHMGRSEPVPSAAITHSYLAGALNFFPMFLNSEAAAGVHFTSVMAFTDPGVGAFTIHVEDGTATVGEGGAPEADLVMTQSAETFEKTFRGILDPVEAIQTGLVGVSDFDSLATFGELFPMS